MESLRNHSDVINSIGKILVDQNRPMKERFRALFTLRNIGGEIAVKCIEGCFNDDSSLLKHECAYCLGQMQDPIAVDKLEEILCDASEEAIVRHEAAEALGAIGQDRSIELLHKYSNDSCIEVAETCQLAAQKIALSKQEKYEASENPYKSVDPAPPLPLKDYNSVNKLEIVLVDELQPLFKRYQAMFSLRNIGTQESALALSKGLTCGTALFRHEIAYVLGQMQDAVTVTPLAEVLRNKDEHEMVRHECAEALGSIATDECINILKDYLSDTKRVVRESCEVALDMCDYENSKEFQYADSLLKAMP